MSWGTPWASQSQGVQELSRAEADGWTDQHLRAVPLDKCTKAAILWFCFVVHAVEQLGNKLLLFCYHSFRIFIMQRRNFCCFAPLVADFFHLRNILLLCYSATPVAEFFSSEKFLLYCSLSSRFFSSEKYSATLLLRYPSGRIFLIWEIFCYSATPLPQWQNFSHLRNFLLFCYSTTPVAEFFSSEKLSAILLFCSHTVAGFFHQCFSYCSETTSSKLLWLFVWLEGRGGGTELTTGLVESSLWQLPDVLLAGR